MGRGDVRFLTVEGAAKQLGLHPETVRVHIRKGNLIATQDRLTPGAPYRIEQQEIIRFAAEMGRPL